MIIKIFLSNKKINEGILQEITKDKLSFIEEEKAQSMQGINWENISFTLHDENDNYLEQETKNIYEKMYKNEAYESLNKSDWKIVKQQETGEYIPEEYEVITAKREAIREVCRNKIDRLIKTENMIEYRLELPIKN